MSSHLKSQPTRLKHIAADLGLSIMAVSKALRGHKDIGEETRRKVLERARELNYRPNLLPGQMISGRTRTIGMVLPTIETSYFAELVQGVTSRLRAYGYQLLLCNSDGELDHEREHVAALLGHQVEGIVISPVGAMEAQQEYAYLLESTVPSVMVGRGKPAFAANFFGSDGIAIGRAATEHLIQQGCRRVAHIQGPPQAGSMQRRAGFEQAMAASKRKTPHGYIAGPAGSIEAGYLSMRTLLSAHVAPDGVFCHNDLAAAGALKAILEAGLRVPDEIALVGVGNLIFSDLLRVPLTTIEQHPVAMGERAAEFLVGLVEERLPRRIVQEFVPFELVVRESSMKRTA
ncbi:MAG: LacI family DNA-binding transcriptional regulator [Acidobacteria bacterium]|nr:LacI family DNA-binding transcriptional regulator [Acidobacteriota bacterium]